MNIVLAMDSFKNCLSAPQVCAALQTGFLKSGRELCVRSIPLADGGEGTAACFAAATGAKLLSCTVRDAYGAPKRAQVAVTQDGKTAMLETAQAIGIQGIDKNCLCTKNAGTAGVGDLLQAVQKQGVQTVIFGLGGSATTDGGLGALSALGVVFLDANGKALPPIGASMAQVHSIEHTEALVPYQNLTMLYATDVTNPFFGPTGAAQVFAKQKGATTEDIAALDAGLENLSNGYRQVFGRDPAHVESMGAAGGLCGGLYAAFGGRCVSGFSVLAEAAHLQEALLEADLVVTGEGRTDAQTVFGKLPVQVLRLSQAAGVPCALVSGDVTDAEAVQKAGYRTVVSLRKPGMSKQESIENAATLLEEAAAQLIKD